MSSYGTSRTIRRRRRRDPLALLLALVTLAAVPALGFAAYKLLTRPPDVVVHTQVVSKPRKTAPKPEAVPERSAVAEQARRHYTSMRQTEPAAITGGSGVAGAIGHIAEDVREALGLGKKVLVIWLFDESASSASLRSDVAGQLPTFFAQIKNAEEEFSAKQSKDKNSSASGGDDAPVLSVVGGFSDKVNFATAEPTADVQQVESAASGLKEAAGHVEKPFTAIFDAVQKYAAEYRLKKQRWLTIVLVTDEAGDDEARVDEVAPLVVRYSIPVNCIGTTAPFGSLEGGNAMSEGNGKAKGEVFVRQGPESRYPEWIHLDFPRGRDDAELSFNTHLGPYSLTRLCKESDGEYFPMPPSGGFGWASASSGRSREDHRHTYGGKEEYGYWNPNSSNAPPAAVGSSHRAGPSAPGLPAAYLPSYVPEQVVQQQLSTNKAKRALVDAAKLPHAEVLLSPERSFDNDDEVKRTRALDAAQKPAAKIMPGIDRLVDTLRAGESAEPELKDEPRWQAGYDLAYGRALAAKARCQGYVNMLAVLKNGGKFKNPNSRYWYIESTDEPTGDSVVDKMAVKSRDYLKRVIDKHPGTPWASAAQRELSEPMGWKWVEK